MQPNIIITIPSYQPRLRARITGASSTMKGVARLCWRLLFQAAHGPEDQATLPSQHLCGHALLSGLRKEGNCEGDPPTVFGPLSQAA